MKKYFFALLSLTVLLLIGCQTAPEDNTPLNVENISYSKESTLCDMDLYRSDKTTKPVVMLIHGGAWITAPGTIYEAFLDRSGMEGFVDFFLPGPFIPVQDRYHIIQFHITSPTVR